MLKGTGLLKNFELQLHRPIHHTSSTTNLQNTLLHKTKGSWLNGWLNPFVPVPKSDGNIRLCLACLISKQSLVIKREWHVVPKMVDIIHDLHRAKVSFS